MGLYDDLKKGGAVALSEVAGWVGGSDDDVDPGMMAEALTKSGISLQPTEEKPRAMFHDPYSVMDWGGWRQRPSALTYETLRQMSVSNTVIAAIIQLRTQQLSAFCRPQQGRYDKGYRIILRDRRDKTKGMTRAQQKEAEALERLLETTGLLMPDEKPSDRDSFRAFGKKAVRDILTYDQWCWEKIRDRKGRISRFIALPSETIRPAVSDVEHMDPAERRSRVSHVQVYENTVIAEFSPDDMAWCVMNPRSDLRANGFGFSPIEQIVRLVTAWLFGFEYNTRFFTQGSAIKGLLNIKGAIPDRQMRAFRRMWYSMIAGVQNAWKTPILNSEEIQWISMHSTNREMEYGQWMDWLTKLICALYGIDPLEINFIFGTSGGGAMFDRRPNEAEVTESKDKGLRPMIEHVEDHINQHMLWETNPDFEFSFTGYDSQAEDAERKARAEEAKSFRTIDEVRAMMDEEPLPDGLGEVINDASWLDFYKAKMGIGQDAGGGDPFGGGGDDEGGLPFDFGGDDDGENDSDSKQGKGNDAQAGKPPSDAQTASQSGGQPSGSAKKSLGLSQVIKSLEGAERLASRFEQIDIWIP